MPQEATIFPRPTEASLALVSSGLTPQPLWRAPALPRSTSGPTPVLPFLFHPTFPCFIKAVHAIRFPTSISSPGLFLEPPLAEQWIPSTCFAGGRCSPDNGSMKLSKMEMFTSVPDFLKQGQSISSLEREVCTHSPLPCGLPAPSTLNYCSPFPCSPKMLFPWPRMLSPHPVLPDKMSPLGDSSGRRTFPNIVWCVFVLTSYIFHFRFSLCFLPDKTVKLVGKVYPVS